VNQPYAVDVDSELVDLAGVSLDRLPELDQEILGPVMDRLLRRVDDPESITSGYNPQRLD
jgi:FXSXX-COOH protein